MRLRAALTLALASASLTSPAYQRQAWAHPNLRFLAPAASPTSQPPRPAGAAKPPGALLLAPPNTLTSAAPAAAALADTSSPWSVGRKLGLGLMLAAPLLASGSIYYRNKALAEADQLQTDCANACMQRHLPAPDHARPHPGSAPWLLLGAAGAASLAGGGLLFWINRPKAARETGPRAAVQVGRDGRPSAVIFGSF